MRVKVIAVSVFGVLAFAAIAQATGVMEHKDPRLDEIQSRAQSLANGLQREPSQAGASRVRRGPRGIRGPRGPQGAKGAKGAQGIQGAQGPAGTFGSIVSVQSPSTFLCSFETGACAVGSARVECPPNTAVTGGGYAGAGIFTTVTFSARSGNGWGVIAINFDEVPVTGLRAEALCATH